jgi:hypothetical protein
MARTRHVYLEQTDRVGTSWPMRYAVAEDLEAIAQLKKKSAEADRDRIWEGVLAAKRMERESGGVEVVFSQNAAYHEHWLRANNYCGAFHEYGSEYLARAFATGTDITIHPLETVASRHAALDRCRPTLESAPSLSADASIGATFDTMCAAILRDVALDQSLGRPHATTNAASCVLDGRHRTMAARIADAVNAGEMPFVIVGRGHLMSGQNLIELLAARGIAIRRIG